jgi:hypothetical protein
MWPIGQLDRGFASLPFDRFAISVLFTGCYFWAPPQCVANSTLVMNLVLSSYMPEITGANNFCYTKK